LRIATEYPSRKKRGLPIDWLDRLCPYAQDHEGLGRIAACSFRLGPSLYASQKKINLEKIKTSLFTLCTECGYKIQPANAAHPHATVDAKRGETASADRPAGVKAP
jgi:hypothetical protein